MGPQDVAADIHVRSAVLFHIGVAVKLEGRQQTVKVGGQRGSWSSLFQQWLALPRRFLQPWKPVVYI